MGATMDPLRELYQEVILDHGKNPRNQVRPEGANRQARGNNPICGDRVTVYLRLDESGKVADLGFEGRGCAISQASASMMTEAVKGLSLEETERLFRVFQALCTGEEDKVAADIAACDEDQLDRLRALSGVKEFPARVKCATLAWHTLQAAIEAPEGGEEVTTEV